MERDIERVTRELQAAGQHKGWRRNQRLQTLYKGRGQLQRVIAYLKSYERHRTPTGPFDQVESQVNALL